MKKRLLFVDDEPNVLQGLRRMLHPMRHEWHMAFATNGEEALQQLAREPFDVVVSDMRMPGMDGAQLLTEVRQRYPHIMRIVLSGHSEREMILRSVGPAHQYLSKPCDAETVKSTIVRVYALRDLLAHETFQQLVSCIKTLPSLPSLYLEMTKIIESANASLEEVGQVIERDMGMAAKILQLVNSAFFGLRRHVSSPGEAVKLLGLDIIKALVLSMQIFEQSDPVVLRRLQLDTLWDHSLAVATCARQVARLAGCERKVIDETYMAGLLHDLGKLIFAANLPDQYAAVLTSAQQQGITVREVERAALGASHAEVGGYLVGLWGLPTSIVEALAFHHCPSACPEQTLTPLTAVHVANVLVHEDEAGNGSAPIDHAYLTVLGLDEQVTQWRESYNAASAAASHG